MSSPIRIELPVPFPVRTVNAYLLPGEPLTLVDAGVRSDASLAALEGALAAAGHHVEDIELLVLTHHHVDHVGLAATVRRRSGCEVVAHRGTAQLVRDWPAARAAEDAWVAALLGRHRAPPEVVAAVAPLGQRALAFMESVVVDRELEEDDTIVAGDRTLRVRLRPGHSATDTVLLDQDGWSLVGDHLLAGPSTALMENPDVSGAGRSIRPSMLLTYRASLAATTADTLTRAFPGHGAVIEQPNATIAAHLARQERLADRLLDELQRRPRTAWELVDGMRRGPAASGACHPVSLDYVMLSHVLGHLDLLESTNRAREVLDEQGRIAYASA